MLRRVVWWLDTNASDNHVATIFKSERWRQHGPPKRWYPTATLHGVTAQKNSTLITVVYLTLHKIKYRRKCKHTGKFNTLYSYL